MRKIALSTLVPLTLALAACAGMGDSTPSKSTLAVIGDFPYGLKPGDDEQFKLTPAFIEAINRDAEVTLTVHVGDIHSGKTYCTEEYNRSIQQLWSAFRMPLVYTPGDNEWSDCHKEAEGGGAFAAATKTVKYVTDAGGRQVDHAGGNPVANLDLVRSIFFKDPAKSTIGALPVHSQGQEFDPAFPADRTYIENTWWVTSGVLFVTLNIPGGSNNDTDPWYNAPSMGAEQEREVRERTAANLRWLDTAFKQAKAEGVVAVAIMTQADMWDVDGKDASHLTQYKPFVDGIARNTTAFGKPVILFNGDSHYYRSDNPLVKGAPCVIEMIPGTDATCSDSVMQVKNPADPYATQPHGYNVPNFHRVVVHGSVTPLEWLKLVVDPGVNAPAGANAFGPFAWHRMKSKQ